MGGEMDKAVLWKAEATNQTWKHCQELLLRRVQLLDSASSSERVKHVSRHF
jgi:hypothetical protein